MKPKVDAHKDKFVLQENTRSGLKSREVADRGRNERRDCAGGRRVNTQYSYTKKALPTALKTSTINLIHRQRTHIADDQPARAGVVLGLQEKGHLHLQHRRPGHTARLEELSEKKKHTHTTTQREHQENASTPSGVRKR